MGLWNSLSTEEKMQRLKDMKLEGASADEAAGILGVKKSTVTSFLCRNYTAWSGLLQCGGTVQGDEGIYSGVDEAVVECHRHLLALYKHHPMRAPKTEEAQQLYNGSLPYKSSVPTFTYSANAA